MLATTIIGETAPGATASVHVPYLDLFGYAQIPNTGLDTNGPGTITALPTTATLTLDADFIDIANSLTLGGKRVIGSPSQMQGMAGPGTYTSFSFGFADTVLDSAGDIRFDQATSPTQNTTSLTATGNVTLQGQQVYPATQATATVIAGEQADQVAGVNPLAGGTLTVLGQPGAAPAGALLRRRHAEPDRRHDRAGRCAARTGRRHQSGRGARRRHHRALHRQRWCWRRAASPRSACTARPCPMAARSMG